ncbi:MAG TPA: hypothetical protein VI357_09100 [Mycobacteriales bacterium]
MGVAGQSVTAGTVVPTEPELFSPFGTVVSEFFEPVVPAPAAATLESPFGPGYAREPDRGEAELLAETAQETLAELEDEDFTDALEALVDEAAARHLADAGSWSVPPSDPQAHELLQQWIEPLAAEAERSLDTLAEQLGGIDAPGLGEGEVARLLDSAGDHGSTGNEVFDHFLGSLLRKAKNAVSGAVSLARRGLDAVGRLLPVGVILGKLKALVRPLLDKVLQAAIGRLPVSVQPIARTLATKLGLGPATGHETDSENTVARLEAELDTELAGLVVTGAGAPEQEAPADGRSVVGELDDARARLAQQLAELPAGSPAAEIEQFIPAVLAVRPLVKLGISMIGRDKVVGFIADRIAGLVQPLIGPDGARRLSRPLVDVGLRALGFEAAAPDGATLAGEALASTVEGTVLRLTELPAQAFADELQLEAAIRTAFAQAAAASMPAQLLRPDLPERETADEGGVWILMPRSARPRYRYRRYSRALVVPISRQVARTVPWSDGGTLESHLLDRGAGPWPVTAEVELYETLPGAQLGHLAAEADPARGEASELQPLTPEIAGLLLREPGLGRDGSGRGHHHGHQHHRRPWPGRRYYRVRPVGGAPAGTPAGRPQHRVAVRLSLTGPAPALRVVLRLTERQGHELLDRLDPAARRTAADRPGALAGLTGRLRTVLPPRVVRRLVRAGVVADAAAAGPIADRVLAGVMTAVSEFVTQGSHLLTAAVRDPAPGVTLTVTFAGISKQSLATALPAGQVSVTPGWGRHD